MRNYCDLCRFSSPKRGTISLLAWLLLSRRGVSPEQPLDHILERFATLRRNLGSLRGELGIDMHLPRRHTPGSYQRCRSTGVGGCHDEEVPNQPKTPHRAFRIPDDIYQPALEKAQAEGTTLSDVVRNALIEYIESDGTVE